MIVEIKDSYHSLFSKKFKKFALHFKPLHISMDNNKYFIIDFDSTFTRVEALDELGEISLEGRPDKGERLKKIADITNQGMNGEGSFSESLRSRIDLLQANRHHLDKLIDRLETKVSKSIERNKDFFKQFSDNVLIVSSGFKEFITPIVTKYGIQADNVHANSFQYDENDNIVGFDTKNVLSGDNGKVKLLKKLKLQGDVYVIGDGYTDYEIREAGLANKFYAFTENVEREKVTAKADHIAPSFDEFLYQNNLPMAISYPKNRIRALLLENVHPDAKRMFKEEGYKVEIEKGAMDEDELIERIKNVSILGIRSKTNVTKKVLDNAPKLMAIGAFCIGTNQIDLEECAKRGITVFNAPYSNTRSVVELAIGELILLMRNIPDKSTQMHQGVWNKSATNSFEVRNKKLGIVGYGNIGSQLSIVAEALGMQVYFYDIVDRLALGNAKKCRSLKELLSSVDIVTLHVDGRTENKNIFGAREFDMMRDNSYFLNLSRGFVVDVEALRKNIDSGKILGAAVDVFPQEPKTNSEPFESVLMGAKNTILTPHIGGSTAEAQEHIGSYVPAKIMEYINTGSTFGSVNFPNLQLPSLTNAHRLMHVHKNVPGILAKINNILAKHECNILGQYLKTNEDMGYVITDVDKEHGSELIKDLKEVPDTIKFRVLY